MAILAAAVACAGAGAAIVPATQADQSHPATVHAYIAHDGSTVVTGYDGGVAITGRAP